MNISVLMPDNDVRSVFIPPHGDKILRSLGNVTYNSGDYGASNLKDLVKDSHVCITGWGCPRLDESIIGQATNLKLVAHTGGTVSPIVSDYMFEQGIKVISGNLIYAESVAEGTIAYILAALRKLPYYNKLVQEGNWSVTTSQSAGLLDKTVGLVGFGAIARFLVPMLKVFRADVQVYDPFVESHIFEEYGVKRVNSLEEIFSGCEIVSLHLAQLPETFHLINADLLSMLPDGALLVNTARGSTIDEKALALELISGRINALLDVFEEEPLPQDSPLRGLDNAILIPHMAGPTQDRRSNVIIALAKDISNLFKGLPLKHEISKEYAVRMTT